MILLNKAKNYIINGAFDFWQRGTSFPAIANNVYFADRFQYGKTGTMVHTVSRSTDVPTNSIADYSALFDVTTAQGVINAGDYCVIHQKIEGQIFKPLRGKKIVVGFRVKAFKPGTYCISFRNSGGTKSIVKEFTIAQSNVWEKHYVAFQHDAAGTWLYDSGIGMFATVVLAAGTTYQTTPDVWQDGLFFATANQVNGVDNLANDFLITEIQFEQGVEPSNFERAGGNYVNELSICQRYYEKSYSFDTAPGALTEVGSLMWGAYANGTNFTQGFFQTTKRAIPTCTAYSPATGNPGSIRNRTTAADVGSGAIDRIATNTFAMVAGGLTASNSMSGHWTADAEL